MHDSPGCPLPEHGKKSQGGGGGVKSEAEGHSRVGREVLWFEGRVLQRNGGQGGPSKAHPHLQGSR